MIVVTSIVQGSGIGPALYIVMKSDLYALSELNDYADDTTLLVPEHTDTELEVEFNHIKAWAAANCLHLNLSKTKEVVFRQPRITYFHLPPAVGDIEQVNCFKLLGVIFSV